MKWLKMSKYIRENIVSFFRIDAVIYEYAIITDRKQKLRFQKVHH